MYTISCDKDVRCLRIHLRDFWTEATAHAFRTDLRNACSCSNEFDGAIIDARAMLVQTARVVAMLQDALDDIDAPHRAALIMPTGLARLQGLRAFPDSDTCRAFQTEADALQWVLGG
ncbi:hypothetical protein ASE85_11060 [Sphingobium sp. Leaf26]|uniref:hypothetical protein n=1 Tax=Sphingobium sp. Leaf26 TaxID=1735693 RepID=UPI0006FFB9C5|nr:hypothetical protein [Sphingobium sp. Leaf26]KQM99242.1 hypothetical protein ASE85_11060 [Sphingobium sp. Leaf26]